VADGWRLGVTFVALALLPLCWYGFLRGLGAFGSHDELTPTTEQQQRDKLVRCEHDNTLATTVAYRLSVLSLLVLLVFGNFFLPYVLLRWGWGGV
jgi:Na+(H+)/acetate symporter ActP